MAGRRPRAGHRSGCRSAHRVLRRTALCALGVLVLAGGSTVLLQVSRHPAATADPALVAARQAPAAPDLSAPDPQRLRPSPPRGYRAPAAPTTPTPAPPATPAPGRTTTPARTTTAAPAAPRATAAPARTPAATTARGTPLPLAPAVGSATQVVTVVARSSRATTATLTAWQKGADGWTAVIGPVTARIGAAGVGVASERTSRTPAGVFPLTEAFGRLPDPGTALPYRVVGADAWWVSDAASPLYNRFTECARASCPFDTSAGEHLLDAGASYDHAVVIDHNRWPAVPGRGSAFFLHVTDGAATAGCVAVPEATLVQVMRWLQPAAHPRIAIGVG